MADDAPASGGGGSILTRKTGPLANWIWMSILLLLALVYSIWKRNQASANAVEEGPEVEEVGPGDQTPPPVFILPQNPQPSVIINNTTPGGPGPTPATPKPAPPVATKPTPTATPPKPAPPAKPTIAYDAIKVTKYTTKNPPWNSTLWGIAKQKGYGAGSTNWHGIWNDPKNAALKKKRGDPKKIQPGDTIYVRRK